MPGEASGNGYCGRTWPRSTERARRRTWRLPTSLWGCTDVSDSRSSTASSRREGPPSTRCGATPVRPRPTLPAGRLRRRPPRGHAVTDMKEINQTGLMAREGTGAPQAVHPALHPLLRARFSPLSFDPDWVLGAQDVESLLE